MERSLNNKRIVVTGGKGFFRGTTDIKASSKGSDGVPVEFTGLRFAGNEAD